ncbi:hypothetical protein ACH5RR_015736 [Cinchona calisaya]|uniref:RNase H type-1 domain-containing protein n=1 Tax=Cinchona calisaya TaxID=153742 RepID=A0ABD2ZXL1_9GENT
MGFVKLSTDAVVQQKEGVSVVGNVARNSAEHILTAWSFTATLGISSFKLKEVEAIRLALLKSLKIHWSNIWVESSAMVNLLHHGDTNDVRVGVVIANILYLVKCFTSCVFSSILRRDNRASHGLVSHATRHKKLST